MRPSAHDDIRRLLKEFGLTADETISAYIVETKPEQPLKIRITLEDITEYDTPPEWTPSVEMEGEVQP